MYSTTTTGYPVGFQDQGAQSQGYASINQGPGGADVYNQPLPPYPQVQQQVYPQSLGYPQNQPYTQQGGYTYGPPGHPATPGSSVNLPHQAPHPGYYSQPAQAFPATNMTPPMPNQAGDDGIYLTFKRCGAWHKKRISGSDGSEFFLTKAAWKWKLDWVLYDYSNGVQGKELFTVHHADSGSWLDKPLVLEDLRPGGLGTIVTKTSSQWKGTMEFDFNGRTYLWTMGNEGFRLGAFEEKDLKKEQRTVFAKYKLVRQDIKIYNAGSHLPPVLVILTGFAMQKKTQDRQGIYYN